MPTDRQISDLDLESLGRFIDSGCAPTCFVPSLNKPYPKLETSPHSGVPYLHVDVGVGATTVVVVR